MGLAISSGVDRGALQQKTQTTSPYSLLSGDSTLLCNMASAMVVNLPAASTATNKVYEIKNIGTSTVAVTPNGTDNLEGVNAAWTLYPATNTVPTLRIECDGTAWRIL